MVTFLENLGRLIGKLRLKENLEISAICETAEKKKNGNFGSGIQRIEDHEQNKILMQ